jgi:hypothetical protein
MSACKYRYEFTPEIALEDVEASLVLAILSVESLHGETEVQLSASHLLDAAARSCVIDAVDPVGRDLNRLFVGFLMREYGKSSFQVRRLMEAGVPAAATV